MKVDDYRRQIGAILWTMYEKKCAEVPKRQNYDPTKLTNAEGYSAKVFDLNALDMFFTLAPSLLFGAAFISVIFTS